MGKNSDSFFPKVNSMTAFSVGLNIELLNACMSTLRKLVLELTRCSENCRSFQYSVRSRINLLGTHSFLLGKLVLKLARCSKN